VPLYEVRVSGYDEGNYISETFKAIRFGVYHNKKTGAGPFVTKDYAGVYSGRWEKHAKLGDVIRVLGAGNGHVLFHVGPANAYVPGANGCVEIFGSGQFQYFQTFVNSLAVGAANNTIRFEPAAQPPLSPKRTSHAGNANISFAPNSYVGCVGISGPGEWTSFKNTMTGLGFGSVGATVIFLAAPVPALVDSGLRWKP